MPGPPVALAAVVALLNLVFGVLFILNGDWADAGLQVACLAAILATAPRAQRW